MLLLLYIYMSKWGSVVSGQVSTLDWNWPEESNSLASARSLFLLVGFNLALKLLPRYHGTLFRRIFVSHEPYQGHGCESTSKGKSSLPRRTCVGVTFIPRAMTRFLLMGMREEYWVQNYPIKHIWAEKGNVNNGLVYPSPSVSSIGTVGDKTVITCPKRKGSHLEKAFHSKR